MIAKLLLFISFTALAGTEPKSDWDFSEFEKTPVLSGGRIKPMDTWAREIVLGLTGSQKYKNWKPVDFVLSIVTDPKSWSEAPILKLKSVPVKKQLLMEEGKTVFSPNEAFSSSVVAQYYEEYAGRSQDNRAMTVTAPGSKPDPRERDLKDFLGKLSLFQSLVTGQYLTWVPSSGSEPWRSIRDPSLATESPNRAQTLSVQLIRDYLDGKKDAFFETSRALRLETESQATQHGLTNIGTEVVFNKLRPFQWAWILLIVSALFWSFSMAIPNASWLSKAGTLTTWVGVLFCILGFALRVVISGRPPVSNMYESVIWVSATVMIFAGIIYWRTKEKIVLTVASFVSGLGLVSADLSPAVLDPSIHPLVPVLRSNYWLIIHVLTITLSYAAFFLSHGLSLVTLYWFTRQREPGVMKRIDGLNQLTYRAVQFGVVLVAAGTILGGIWADESWGRFWGWDPKEVWALIVLLIYIAVLHGRFAGWVSPFRFAMLTNVSFLAVLMAWYGVNFVLGVGLHSYGFSTGGVTTVSFYSIAVLAYAILITIKVKQHGKNLA